MTTLEFFSPLPLPLAGRHFGSQKRPTNKPQRTPPRSARGWAFYYGSHVRGGRLQEQKDTGNDLIFLPIPPGPREEAALDSRREPRGLGAQRRQPAV